MKRIISVILIISFLTVFCSCGNTKIIDGIEYDTYGLLSKGESCNPDIKYKVIIGNIVWSVILFETLIAPVYFLGFSMYEPTGKIIKNMPKGSIY